MKIEPKKDKKFIAVRGDLLSKIIEIANRDGKTVFSFVNEIFEQAIKADELKASLPDIVEFYSLIDVVKRAGAVITTGDLLNYLITRLYTLEKETLQERWYLSGLWYGRYLSTRFDNALNVFKKILEECMWDVTEANISVNENGDISLRCIAPNYSHESTELLRHFLKGFFHSLNYQVVKEEFWKGIILLNLRKRSELVDIELNLEDIS